MIEEKQEEKQETEVTGPHNIPGVWLITHPPYDLCAIEGPHPMMECQEC